MKKKLFFLAAIGAVALTSCTDDTFMGETTPTVVEENATDGAILFSMKSKGLTRAGEHVGADAASLLNKRFYVGGFKTADGSAYNTVFKDYAVEWTENTAGKTESNTSDWEYVGVTPLSPKNTTTGFVQTIKYWDYSTASYDFIAFATGNDHANAGTKDVADTYETGKIALSAIDHSGLESGAYTLEGDRADLLNCYVADMVTVNKVNYGNEVQLSFRALASKVRMALYETVPGYSVKDVKFYTQNVNPSNLGIDPATSAATTGTAALIGKFCNRAKYTVTFPAAHGHKAHVGITPSGGSPFDPSQTFGTLTANYTTEENLEAAGSIYLGRTSNQATYAGTSAPDNYYVKVLPNETSNNGSDNYSNVLELAVDYTLVSTDGSGEEINVYGATAYVPAAFTQWMPNYAYTYIFKISDATNGWTSKTSTDPKGLFPITFDAVVIDSEENTQKTITTVASPSINTYQKGHDITKNEYSAANGKIYVQVIENGTLKTDLGSKGHLYTVGVTGKTYTTKPADYNTTNNVYYTDADLKTPATAAFSDATTYYKASTEVDVIEALNVIESGTTGRNGVTLTSASSSTTTAVPGENGQDITVPTGSAAEFTPAKGVYAYVYDTNTWNGFAVSLTNDSHPGYPTGYYTDPACTTPAPTDWNDASSAGTYYVKEGYIYTARNLTGTPDSSEAWDSGIWFEDPEGKTPVGAFVAGTYYKRYTVNGKIYAVKVIKVVD